MGNFLVKFSYTFSIAIQYATVFPVKNKFWAVILTFYFDWIFGRGDFLTAILKYQKPMIAWSKTGNHIGGSLPGFMYKFGKGDFLSAFYVQISETSDSLE